MLLLAGAVGAGEIETARALLAKEDVEARKQGITVLVKLDSRDSLEVLVQALRKAHKDFAKRLGTHQKLSEAMSKVIRAEQKLRDDIMGNVGKQAKLSPQKKIKALGASTRRSDAALRKWEDDLADLAPVAFLVDGAANALRRFESPAAITRLEQLAAREPTGGLRFDCLRAVMTRGSSSAAPVLVELSGDRDPRVRALVVRALRRHVAEAGVVDALVAVAEDRCWQVRRGAYASLAAAPAVRAIPPLEAALARERGNQARRLRVHLHELGRGAKPEPVPAGAFGLPLASDRIRFVVDLSRKMSDRIQEVRTELRRAIAAIPDGGTIDVVGLVGDRKVSFASKPTRIDRASRRRFDLWLRKLEVAKSEASGTVDLLEMLHQSYANPGKGARIFEQAPDAIVLVARHIDKKDARLVEGRFRSWNDACDAVLHVRLFDRGAYAPADLREFTEETGGTFRAE